MNTEYIWQYSSVSVVHYPAYGVYHKMTNSTSSLLVLFSNLKVDIE